MTAKQTLERIARNANIPEIEIQELLREWENDHNAAATLRRYIETGTNNLGIPLPFVPIQSEVLVEDVTDLTIQIPSTFRHLLIMGQGRANNTGGRYDEYLYAQFNGDTGSNYIYSHFFQSASIMYLSHNTTANGMIFGYVIAEASAAGFSGSFVVFIPHYNSTYYKSLLTLWGSAYSLSAHGMAHGMWKNTSPVSSIRVYPEFAGGKLEAGSLISIYGIL